MSTKKLATAEEQTLVATRATRREVVHADSERIVVAQAPAKREVVSAQVSQVVVGQGPPRREVVHAQTPTRYVIHRGAQGIAGPPGSQADTDGLPEGAVNLYFTSARAAAAAPVQSVAGRTGAVTLTSADVALDQVDNTADLDKPLSTAAIAALAGKSDTGHSHSSASGAAAGFMSSAHYTKLEGIATGATANSADAYLLDRANHTGSQAWNTITGTPTTLAGYGIVNVSTDHITVEGGTNKWHTAGRVLAVTLASLSLLNADPIDSGSTVLEAFGQLQAQITALGTPQPIDATLTALAGQNWAANTVPVGTGTDTVSQVTLAANTFLARSSGGAAAAKTIGDLGLALVAGADQAAMHSVLGLTSAATTAIGTSGAAIPLLSTANTWGATQTISGTTPAWRWNETDVATGLRYWHMAADGAIMKLQALDDSGTATATPMQITRTGVMTLAARPIVSANTPGFDFYEADQSADARRWQVIINSGAFTLRTASDASAVQDVWLTIARASGAADFAGSLDVTGATTLDSTLAVAGNTALSGTLAVTGATTFSANVTAGNTALHLADTDASHYLIIKPGSNLTSTDKTLTLTTGDNDRTLDISAANVTISSFAATVLDDTSAGAALTTLGGTTLGQSIFTITNVAATRFLRINSDNTVTARSAVEMQTDLSLVPGTNVQAYDADLAALASVTTAADKVPYFTGVGTASVADFTSVARTLVAQTTQANMRTTGLGLGTSATVDTGTSGATIGLLNAANTHSGNNSWTGTNTVSNATVPQWRFNETGAGVDLGLWQILAVGQTFRIRALTDAAALSSTGFIIPRGGGLAVGAAALATTATDGHFWYPSCAGTPTGAVTAPYTNAVAQVYDRTNHKICVSSGGTWRSTAALT